MASTRAERPLPRFYWPAVIACAILAALFFYAKAPILTSLRTLAFDAYQNILPAPPLEGSPVRVVAIDEASLARLGQWPWSRDTMAELTEKLGEAGAAAIVFDVLFAEPDRTSPEQILQSVRPARRAALRQALGADAQSHDAAFAEALSHFPTVIAASLHDQPMDTPFPTRAGFAVAGDDPAPFLLNYPGAALSLPELSEAAQGVGFMNWLPDRDQVVRRVPLLLRYNGEITPSLSLEGLRVALGASTYVLRASNASGAEAFGAQTGMNAIKVGPVTIPTDAEGQMWLRFRRFDPAAPIPAWRVISGEVDPTLMQGAIVLVGASAPGLLDLRATPLDASVPGVEVHRQALEQILAGEFLNRPDFAPGIELLLALVAILILAFAAPRVSPSTNAAIGLALVAAMSGGGLFLFAQANYLFDPVYPTLAALVFGASVTTFFYQRTEHQRAEIRRAFSQYVAPDVVRQLTAHPERLKLGGEVRELTILVCDIRNFSTIAEKMQAEELTAFVNSFLTPVSDIVIESGGTIDKYMGDAILAFWNAPLDQPDHAARACRAALEITARLPQLNAAWRREAEAAGRPFEDVRIGIGVNTGECCVGNLGSERRFDYSAIGDAVNIASRLESLSKFYRLSLLVSEETVQQTQDLTLIDTDLVRLKGRAAATRVFTAFANGSAAPAGHAPFLEAYRTGDLTHAKERLAQLEAEAPAELQDLYALYAERIAAAPAASDHKWDGVFDPGRK